jgi:NAD(P)-dependent dehydrogenase (short-subunit alcohol dehydrogenase family)
MDTLQHYQPQQDLLRSRVILITGAGEGIGKTAAKTMASFGATVILLGRTINKLERVYDEIIAQGSPEPVILPVDLKGARVDDYLKIRDLIDEQFGRLDGILHNAAVLGGLTTIELYDIKKWYDIIQTNLHAPFLLTHIFLSLLKKSSDGRIVFIGDQVGLHGQAYWGAYGVAKAGLLNFMQILADEIEVNTDIRVNALIPPATATRIRKQAFPAKLQEAIPDPSIYMAYYLYLMGPDSKNVNGQIIQIKENI